MSVNNENLKRPATEDLKLDTEDLTCAVCLGKKIWFIEIQKKEFQRNRFTNVDTFQICLNRP